MNLTSNMEGIKEFAKNHEIDDLSNMKGKPIFVYSGTLDTRVLPGVVHKTATIFEELESNVVTDFNFPSEHTFPTDKYGKDCTKMTIPGIGQCGFSLAEKALSHIIGPMKHHADSYNPESFYKFDQGYVASMRREGYAYIPDQCFTK